MSVDNKRDGKRKVPVCVCLHQVGNNPWIYFYKIYSITHLKCVSMATISGMSMKQGKREFGGKGGCLCAPEKGE